VTKKHHGNTDDKRNERPGYRNAGGFRRWLRAILTATIGIAVMALIASPIVIAQAAPPDKGEAQKPKDPQKPPPDLKKTSLNPAQPQQGSPKIVVPNPVHDFGEIWSGTALRNVFVMRNEGTAPLEILKVRRTCGCTEAGPHPDKLEPGESGEFPFSLDSTKVKGKFNKEIKIETNDPSSPTTTLSLVGNCKHYVDVDKKVIHFQSVFGNEPVTRTAKITNNTDVDLELTLPPPSEESKVKYELVEKVPGKEFELIARVEPPYVPGSNVRDKVTLTTNIVKQRTIDIRVSATFPERLSVSPNPLSIKPYPEPVTKQLLFRNEGPTPVKVLDASADDAKLDATVQEKRPGKEYIIRLDIPANYNASAEGATLTVRTDDQEQPELHVRIRNLFPTTRRTRQTTERPAQQLKGQAAPPVAVTTIEGKSLSNADFQDKPTVVNFFAPNCPHCKRQLPTVDAVRKEFESKGVRFVNISQTMRKPFTDEQVVTTVREGFGVEAELAINSDNTVGRRWKATSFPTLFVVDGQGKVAEVIIGNNRTLQDDLTKTLATLLSSDAKTVAQPAETAPKPAAPTAQGGKERATEKPDQAKIQRIRTGDVPDLGQAKKPEKKEGQEEDKP
jgi:thiol-disulfide isomerase/thioredoxin